LVRNDFANNVFLQRFDVSYFFHKTRFNGFIRVMNVLYNYAMW